MASLPAHIEPCDEPKKEDPLCFDGDYAAFRKAYKAWHARKTGKRKHAAMADAFEKKEQERLAAGQVTLTALAAQRVNEPRFKKPRGHAPLADGVACAWDGEHGVWRTASGAVHDVAAKRKAEKQTFFDSKKADDDAVQEQRRADREREYLDTLQAWRAPYEKEREQREQKARDNAAWLLEQHARAEAAEAKRRERRAAELQASALARRSVTGSVVVSATATVRTEWSREYSRYWHSYREDCIPKDVRERKDDLRVLLRLEPFRVK